MDGGIAIAAGGGGGRGTKFSGMFGGGGGNGGGGKGGGCDRGSFRDVVDSVLFTGVASGTGGGPIFGRGTGTVGEVCACDSRGLSLVASDSTCGVASLIGSVVGGATPSMLSKRSTSSSQGGNSNGLQRADAGPNSCVAATSSSQSGKSALRVGISDVKLIAEQARAADLRS